MSLVMKCALFAALGLGVYAYARTIDSVKVEYNTRTGQVRYQVNGRQWMKVKETSEASAAGLVQKVGYYIDSPQCEGNVCGPFYGQGGYEYGQPGYIVPGPQPESYPYGYGGVEQPFPPQGPMPPDGGMPPGAMPPDGMPPQMAMPPGGMPPGAIAPDQYYRQGDNEYREYSNVPPGAPLYYGAPRQRGGGRQLPPGRVAPSPGLVPGMGGGMPPGAEAYGEVPPGAGQGIPPGAGAGGGMPPQQPYGAM